MYNRRGGCSEEEGVGVGVIDEIYRQSRDEPGAVAGPVEESSDSARAASAAGSDSDIPSSKDF